MVPEPSQGPPSSSPFPCMRVLPSPGANPSLAGKAWFTWEHGWKDKEVSPGQTAALKSRWGVWSIVCRGWWHLGRCTVCGTGARGWKVMWLMLIINMQLQEWCVWGALPVYWWWVPFPEQPLHWSLSLGSPLWHCAVWCCISHQREKTRVNLHACHWFSWTLFPANGEFVMGQRSQIDTKTVPLIPALPWMAKVKINASLYAVGHILLGQPQPCPDLPLAKALPHIIQLCCRVGMFEWQDMERDQSRLGAFLMRCFILLPIIIWGTSRSLV